MMGAGGYFVRYLFGDSTESDLEINFLAFLKDVFDCIVVMLEAEHTVGANVERRKVREQQVAGMIRAVEELGKEAAAVVEPVAKEQPRAPVGRCASAISSAIRDAVAREIAQAKSELSTARAAVDDEDNEARTRAYGVLEKLIKQHDLPGAEKDLEIVSSGTAAKAMMRQHTSFGLDVAVELEVPANSIFASELRVDRIDERVEIHALESGGWLKKTDKLVPHRLGRYQVVAVAINGDTTTIRLRAMPDANGTGLTITRKRNGQIAIVGSGANANKEFSVEERDRQGLEGLIEKLVAALRALDRRASLVAADFEGKPLIEASHPRVLAERLIASIAPTVQKIIKHGRSPGELVLRRQLADDRREEIYVPISELTRKAEVLPPQARAAFAPLGLGIDASGAATSSGTKPPESKPPAAEPKPTEAKPAPAVESKPADAKAPANDTRVPARESKSPFVDTRTPNPKPSAEPKLPFVDTRGPEQNAPRPGRDTLAEDDDAKPVEVKHSDTKPLDLKARESSGRTTTQPPPDGKSQGAEGEPRKTKDTKPPEFKPIDDGRPDAKLADVRTAPRTSPPLAITAPRTKPPSNPPGGEARLSPPIASAITPNTIQRDKPKTVPPPAALRESSPGFRAEVPRPEGSQPSMRSEPSTRPEGSQPSMRTEPSMRSETSTRPEGSQPMLSMKPAGSSPAKIEIMVDDDDDDDFPPKKPGPQNA